MATQMAQPAAAIRAHEELFAYWSSLRGGVPVPPRGRLDPNDMKRLLPTVSLIEVMPGATPDYRMRLAGTGLYSVYGREITGRRLAEVYNTSAAEYWRDELGRVVKDRRPGVGVHNLAWRGASHLSLIWIRLPLITQGSEVDMILGYDAVVGLGAQTSGIRAA
ncbi:MAG: PAS domain-containing protein [Alphaproteobacteria bacterium]|nr:PAS domain-containing protein [Alphaproteobacteria bacterium]MBU1512776.1 PAS domain-containing protein [Alphaproteobacteria bacterium]MBU2096561.1 PAS domain-containing protein [Alphaproteobacteria bacterium]MBU2151929.1 PAS domain-containing protein [Alphaproteobacteria bacterium]MBU2306439.1 PAS domain-containing protein [Alphaproteobacteria bacterium]